ncbi:putative RDD family membrane protein YckC [Ectopseudomonas oleovorans]|uniref:Putative RDD family membrane protein YckC n=1 Tax=Ectopseudomonas oleovorans TaxID=301 RepID=A0A397MEC1_ECTOL|nr:RDD family protein [Pseudomonas oleovorans]RIA19914.1 putative RDD family membrane protein YckC [Pseudomonas oleovorans]
MQNQELEYAGFWSRTWAMIIDTILIMLITVPSTVSIYGWSYFTDENLPLIAGPADFLISWVMPAIAVIVFWIVKQATPGKMAISAKIVDATTGQPATPAQLIGRYFAYLISMIPFCIGIFWIAFDRRKQGWHDKLAGTVVIKRVNAGPDPVRFSNR